MDFLKRIFRDKKETGKSEVAFKYNEDKTLSFLNEKWINKACPYCGHNEWSLGSRMYTPVELCDDYAMRLQVTHVLPLTVVTCLNCGNTVFVNLITEKELNSPEKEIER